MAQSENYEMIAEDEIEEEIESTYTTTYDPSLFETSVLEKWKYAKCDFEENPTNITNDYYIYMIENYHQAYCARYVLREFCSEPFWCLSNRMGMSSTELDDGRIIKIAGEHEDDYDPDFFIYNDVFVFETIPCKNEACYFWNSHKRCNKDKCVFEEDGYSETHPIVRNCCFKSDSHKKCTAIYGYPKDSFSPTDFHLTILIGQNIWIIGTLSSKDYRTVYVLDTTTMKITKKITTSAIPPEGGRLVPPGGGNSEEEMPPWNLLYYDCHLRYENNTIILYQDKKKLSIYDDFKPNGHEFLMNGIWVLDLTTLVWTQILRF